MKEVEAGHTTGNEQTIEETIGHTGDKPKPASHQSQKGRISCAGGVCGGGGGAQ